MLNSDILAIYQLSLTQMFYKVVLISFFNFNSKTLNNIYFFIIFLAYKNKYYNGSTLSIFNYFNVISKPNQAFYT